MTLELMHLLNCTRSANDALAVMRSTGVVVLALRPPHRRLLRLAAGRAAKQLIEETI